MSRIDLRELGLPSRPGFLGGPAVGHHPQPPPGHSFSTIYAFGDSLSDAGNDYNLTMHTLPTAPYVDGHFTNGPVWVQDLATDLGLAVPQASTSGGTDFAYGDAETGQEGLHDATLIDLPSQLAQFAASQPTPQPNALYTLSIGSNDVFDAASAFATRPAAAIADVLHAVGNEVAFIAALAADGARNFAVLDVPDLGKTPAATAEGSQAVAVASGLSALYDVALGTSLTVLAAADHLNLHLIDTYGLLDRAVADPSAFGLTNVTQPVWTGGYDNPASGTLNATGAAQNSFLFFDSVHPTAAGHALLAAAALSSLQSSA